jgi:hypothetical protein
MSGNHQLARSKLAASIGQNRNLLADRAGRPHARRDCARRPTSPLRARAPSNDYYYYNELDLEGPPRVWSPTAASCGRGFN